MLLLLTATGKRRNKVNQQDHGERKFETRSCIVSAYDRDQLRKPTLVLYGQRSFKPLPTSQASSSDFTIRNS